MCSCHTLRHLGKLRKWSKRSNGKKTLKQKHKCHKCQMRSLYAMSSVKYAHLKSFQHEWCLSLSLSLKLCSFQNVWKSFKRHWSKRYRQGAPSCSAKYPLQHRKMDCPCRFDLPTWACTVRTSWDAEVPDVFFPLNIARTCPTQSSTRRDGMGRALLQFAMWWQSMTNPIVDTYIKYSPLRFG